MRKKVAIIVLLLVVLFFIAFETNSFRMANPTMEPSIAEGSVVISNPLAYAFHTPEKDDLVLFDSPQDSSETWVFRVAGIPGDYIEIQDGQLLINHQKIGSLDDKVEQFSTNKEYTLEEDEYFVVGDNFKVSYDSRYWGPLKISSIAGKYLTSF